MKFWLFIFFNILKYIFNDDTITFIDETLLSFTSGKCKDNPFLYLLPNKMRHTIELTLKGKPKKNKLNFCKNQNSGKTCCTSFTKENVQSYLIDHVYTPKQNIYKKNMYYYKDLLSEHKRNLIKGFKLKESDYNNLFSSYIKLINEIILLDEIIVKMSVQYNWDAFCNYICNYPDSLKNCEIYAVRYKVNDKMLYDYKYNCKGNQTFIEEFKNLLMEFQNHKNDLNDSIIKIYDEINKKNEESIFDKVDSKLLTLYNNSIYDGRYVSLDLNRPSLCVEENNTAWINYYLNGTTNNSDTQCSTILNNPCGLFSCLDAFFLEFFDSQENNGTDILLQFNNSKIKINLSDPGEMVYFNFSKDIQKLVKKKLTFSVGEYIVIKNILLYIISLIVFIF